MSEGPVNFGKPLLWIVIVACVGGGYYAYTHWPVSYDGEGWGVSFPNKWEAKSAGDSSTPSRITASGPLLEEIHGQGTAWAFLFRHGTLAWPDMAIAHIPGTPDKQDDVEIDHKRALIFEYEDNNIRYLGASVQRGDALVMFAIGCPKPFFDANRPGFEKVVKSVRCWR